MLLGEALTVHSREASVRSSDEPQQVGRMPDPHWNEDLQVRFCRIHHFRHLLPEMSGSFPCADLSGGAQRPARLKLSARMEAP